MMRTAAFLVTVVALSHSSIGGRSPVNGRSKASPAHQFVELDPIGKYALNTVMRGKPASLVATILTLGDGSLGGDLSGSGINSVRIIDVRVQDSTLKFAVNATEDIKASFVLLVSGDSVSGRWSMPGDSSTVTGHRLHQDPVGARPE